MKKWREENPDLYGVTLPVQSVFQLCCVTADVKRDFRHVITPELLIWLLISQKLKAVMSVLQNANAEIRLVKSNF